MFTGIVEEVGRIERLDGARYRVEAKAVLPDLMVGDSVSVSGCCLTVIDLDERGFVVDLVDETLRRTALGVVAAQSGPVNLERAVRMDQRLNGHLVQGHVDTTGEVISVSPMLAVWVSHDVRRYLVEKGSVAIDGCSLTVAGVDTDSFSVALIPHTSSITTLGNLKVGDKVNIEVDVIAKYVESLMTGGEGVR